MTEERQHEGEEASIKQTYLSGPKFDNYQILRGFTFFPAGNESQGSATLKAEPEEDKSCYIKQSKQGEEITGHVHVPNQSADIKDSKERKIMEIRDNGNLND